MTVLPNKGARTLPRFFFSIFIALLLTACGGADSDQSDTPVVNPADYVRAAGQDFSIVGGNTAPFFCQGPFGTSYQWSVESNGALPIDLVSYSDQRTSFVAPTVQVATPVILACRMTNGSAAAILSRVTVTIQPVTTPPIINPADYVHAAGQNFGVAVGSTAPFFCQGPTGSTYQWVVESNGGLPIDLSSYSEQKTSFVAPAVLATTTVVLACKINNGTVPQIVSKVNVTVQPANLPPVFNPSDYLHAAGQDFNVTGGAIAPFYCLGPDGSSYQWVVESNGNLPIELSSYNTQRTSFTSPAVTQTTPIVLACRMTVGASSVIASRVTANLQPVPATPGLTLVTTITGNRSTLPGQRLALTSNAAWYDDKAAVAAGPLLNYTWSLGTGAPAGTVLTPQTGSKDVEVVLPTNIASAVFFPVTVRVSGGLKSSEATITVLVDPSGELNPTITPQAQTVIEGTVVSVSTTASSKLFYQWTVVDNTTLTLGGATTNTVGFVAPAPGPLRLRVAIGYAPISSANPGVYFLESVVNVLPR